jgi:prepilin-type N-terminal cleavage/methylation domain-containing protein
MKTTFTARSGSTRQGFTMVEIMIVVVIIGLLAALAIPAFQRVRRKAQNTRFASDLRTFAQAFETYAMEKGVWPANAGSGVVPAALVGDISSKSWTETNTLGGRWNWDQNRLGITAAIATTGVTVDATQMAEIDAMIDDGNLATGTFIENSGRYMWVLE